MIYRFGHQAVVRLAGNVFADEADVRKPDRDRESPMAADSSRQKIHKVVLVGHCGADQFMLQRAVSQALGDVVSVTSVNDWDTLVAGGGPGSLMLVNRVLDGRFGTGSGVELIGRLCGQPDPPVTVLVSNFEDAQEQAVGVGALRGFGKSDLNTPTVAGLLKQMVFG